ncbi:hypothetical protein B0T25DRAFT_22325 [Lasiosphaeria hispida]|uniref:Uncharacterized protein n=1 Tax=Lasiosphaeria hispida TaxID=260671 RepID=A0AAJ0HU19_9PEZI|nr:hypothetical protein B0T25DRAFT_22325 [Lasiosphaeria hispida]
MVCLGLTPLLRLALRVQVGSSRLIRGSTAGLWMSGRSHHAMAFLCLACVPKGLDPAEHIACRNPLRDARPMRVVASSSQKAPCLHSEISTCVQSLDLQDMSFWWNILSSHDYVRLRGSDETTPCSSASSQPFALSTATSPRWFLYTQVVPEHKIRGSTVGIVPLDRPRRVCEVVFPLGTRGKEAAAGRSCKFNQCYNDRATYARNKVGLGHKRSTGGRSGFTFCPAQRSE